MQQERYVRNKGMQLYTSKASCARDKLSLKHIRNSKAFYIQTYQRRICIALFYPGALWSL